MTETRWRSILGYVDGVKKRVNITARLSSSFPRFKAISFLKMGDDKLKKIIPKFIAIVIEALETGNDRVFSGLDVV